MILKSIKEWAAERGCLLGVAPVRPFAGGKAALVWREEQGLSTPFVSGRLEERYEPLLLYPVARALVVIARPNPQPLQPPGPGEGLIANYARGRDYHIQLRSLLQGVAAKLEDAGAKLTAIQVDNGPLLEREAAYYAGLGYYGANCNLIVPGYGSDVALAVLVTDLELEPGEPIATAACNNCGKCMAACPTAAITSPGRLDPQRCLSYLTQTRGVIPVGLRLLLGQRIWGCDVCQEVCPANRYERLSRGASRIKTRADSIFIPNLATIISLTNREYKQVFGGTALAWRGKTSLQRNAVIALGNRGEVDALPSLEQAIAAPAAVVRGHAAWALGRLGSQGRLVLERAWKRETDPYVLHEITRALDDKKACE
ncbi:MAG: tRNA epoxyqueuosine(34) reductase QueG [Clostridia bacterium]|nr:tRNA epoxyqueuosine(34) reductase QueG [Clostridia bacterium]